MFTILCPTDFSEVSDNAIRYAVEIAKLMKGRVHLSHMVVPTYVEGGIGGAVVLGENLDEVKLAASQRLEKLIKALMHEQLSITYSVEFGYVDSVLVELEERVDPDLLVTGTHGSSSVFLARLTGMNSLSLVRNNRCPVLVVPNGYAFSELKNIVYATDYQFEDIDYAELVKELAELHSAKINFIHVSHSDKKVPSDQELMDWFKDMTNKQLKYENVEYTVLKDKNTEHALEKYALDAKVDLMCVSMRDKSFWQELMGHNHTYRFVVDAVVPVLVFHLHDDFKL